LQTARLYKFGSFQLDPAEHLLLREGQAVPLTPKTFELLVFLVSHRGRLVTKDQILAAVWPESFVEEANLTVSVSALRKALGERPGEKQLIDTVPKKGYRFTASVTEVEGSAVLEAVNGRASAADQSALTTVQAQTTPAEVVPRDAEALPADLVDRAVSSEAERSSPVEIAGAPSSRARKLAIALILIAAGIAVFVAIYRARRQTATPVAPRSLAVLPFQNLAHDPANDFLGFSLADAIINRLGYVNQLTIRPSYAVQKYRTEIPDIQQAARNLSVDTLLTGSFIREGDNLRVSYQLVDAAGNRILRQGTMDVKYQKLLAVQDDVSAQVISALALTLSPAETENLRAQQTIPPLAYEYYLRGVDLYSRGDFPLAIKMLEKSIEIYPDYALTWAHLGRAYTASASFNFGGAELYSKAKAAYEKALSLEPTLALARIYMANFLTDTGKAEQAIPLLREALRTNPNLAEAHWELGYAYRYGGMLTQSVEECNRARELDPSVKLTSSAINAYLYLGDYDSFLRSLPAANDSAYIEFYRGFALYHMRQFERAAGVFDHAYELDPAMPQTQVGKALSYHIQHDDKKGLELLNAAENKIRQRAVGDPEAAYKLAQAYAELGDSASALRIFRHCVETGFFPYAYFANDPLMSNVRQQAEFQATLEEARRRSDAFRRLFASS
jgi:DNA-binding winged helix-turn-helix (wHTH) protein/TolB-like protein/cytochrome c-type biogenesis protein CcmH/NrfG